MNLATGRSPLNSERSSIAKYANKKLASIFSYQNGSDPCLGPRVLATPWEEAGSDTNLPQSARFLFIFNMSNL